MMTRRGGSVRSKLILVHLLKDVLYTGLPVNQDEAQTHTHHEPLMRTFVATTDNRSITLHAPKKSREFNIKPRTQQLSLTVLPATVGERHFLNSHFALFASLILGRRFVKAQSVS